MIILSNILYLSFPDLLRFGVSENYLWKAVSKSRTAGGKSWISVPDPNDKRSVLIEYDSIPTQTIVKYKIPAKADYIKQIEAEIQQKQQLESKLAKANLQQYIQINDKELSDLYDVPKLDKGKAYDIAKACAICSFYNNLPARKEDLLKYGFETKAQILESLFEIVKKDDLSVFPAGFERFQRKFTDYKKQGIQAFITKKIGNTNRLKLENEEQKAFLRQLYGRPNNYSPVKVTDDYNEAVKQINAAWKDTTKHWKTLSLSTVKAYLSQPEVQKQCKAMRNGMRDWRNDYDVVIHRDRPSRPNLLWVEDGTPFELYYQREVITGTKRTVNYWCRMVVSFVIDAFNDLIVGFSIDDEENADMKYQAWKMAATHTGYLPYEVKADHFAKKRLMQLYEGMSKHVRLSSVGNARDKVIEPMFAKFTEAVLKQYSNWSGCNITSRKQSSHPNREYLMQIKETFPDKAGVIQQIIESINTWNNRPLKKLDGKSLLQQWSAANKHDQNRLLTPENRIEIFGVASVATLTNKGLMPVINGNKYVFQLWDHNFQDRTGDTFQIKYDPDNLSLIAATDSKGDTYYVPLENKEKMAFSDYAEGDRTSLNRKLEFKKEIPQRVIDANAKDMSILESHSVLKQFFIGNTNKHTLNQAENQMKALSQPDEYDVAEFAKVPAGNYKEFDEYDL